jgi:nicotinate-nucleotide adenylyltransferase
MEKRADKIGLFGGTFDPVHLGHLIIAQAVLENAGLDRMIFIPSARPPHKGHEMMFDAGDRLAMLSRAIRGNPSFAVSDIEMRRSGLSFTIDTIREMKALHPPGTEFFFLVGRDNLYEIETWRDPHDILAECTLLVAERVCSDERIIPPWIMETVHSVPAPVIEISSTDIRTRIREGRSIRYLVPEGVAEMIQKYDAHPR